MSTGYASANFGGMVLLNASQAVAQYAATPAVVLEDATNGSTVMHLGGSGIAPTLVAGSGLGTGGSPAVTLDANATDFCGQISIKGGTSAWAIGPQAVITFNVPYLTAPYVVITPANAATALIFMTRLPYTTSTTTTWTLNYAVVDSAQHTFLFNFLVAGH